MFISSAVSEALKERGPSKTTARDAQNDVLVTTPVSEMTPAAPTRENPLRRWLARWWQAAGSPSGSRPAEVLAVLQHAYAIVEAGWVQNRWHVRAPVAPTVATSARVANSARPEVRACVVGAVAIAVRARNPHADLAMDTGPAVAFLWDAVREQSNHGFVAGGTRRAAGRAAPREERIARLRDLARWNDERGRTRADVLVVLDRAAARATEAAVAPAGRSVLPG